MAVKKATKKAVKKAAKKTYTSSKKAVPKLKKVTLDEVLALHAKVAAAQDRNEAAIDRLTVQNDRTAAVAKKAWAAFQAMSVQLGRLGNDIGELTEFIVIPKIRLAMNAVGKYAFNSIQTDKLYKTIDGLGEKKTFTEVDVLLSGETEVMAVETKTRPAIRDVKKHEERLETLRRHEELVGIKDKKLYGAIVGAVMDKEVKTFALERGLYVVKIREEEEKLDISKPETCRAW
jgi:hypothetical protein